MKEVEKVMTDKLDEMNKIILHEITQKQIINFETLKNTLYQKYKDNKYRVTTDMEFEDLIHDSLLYLLRIAKINCINGYLFRRK